MAYVSMSFSLSKVLQYTIIIMTPYLVHVDYSYNIPFNIEYTIIIIRSIIIHFKESMIVR